MKAKSLVNSLWGLVLLTTTLISNADNEQFVVFGDSLSDPGNFFQLFGEQEIQPFEVPGAPAAPYAIGGHHFSNGETWIEQLSRRLGTQGSGSPATMAPGMFTNYAIGRSRARNELLNGVFDAEGLSSQVDRFLEDHASIAPAEATYVVWIGSNDTSDAIVASLQAGDPSLTNQIISLAVGNIAAEIKRLHDQGARDFLIPNVPNLANTPVFRRIAVSACGGSPACEQYVLWVVSQISAGFNGAMSLALAQVSLLPDISIRTVDVSGFLAEVIADPQTYGLQNATESCTTPGTVSQALCQNPAEYLFWDGLHPTRAGHKLLADYFAAQIAQ